MSFDEFVEAAVAELDPARPSVSRLRLFNKCPEAFRQRYVLNRILPPSGALTLGKAAHEAEALNMAQKVATGEDLPLEQVQDTFSDAFERDKAITEWAEDEDPGKEKDMGLKLVEVYQTQLAPTIRPVMVEKRITLPIAGEPFIAILDLADDQDRVHDTKHVARRYSPEQVQNDIQLTAYDMAFRAETGREPTELRLNAVLKQKAPGIDSQATHRTEADFASFEYNVEQFVKAVRAGIFVPNRDSWLCSKKNCGYFGSCAATRGL